MIGIVLLLVFDRNWLPVSIFDPGKPARVVAFVLVAFPIVLLRQRGESKTIEIFIVFLCLRYFTGSLVVKLRYYVLHL